MPIYETTEQGENIAGQRIVGEKDEWVDDFNYRRNERGHVGELVVTEDHVLLDDSIVGRRQWWR